MKKHFRGLCMLLLLFLSLILSSCTQTDKQAGQASQSQSDDLLSLPQEQPAMGGELRYGVTTEIDSLDAHLAIGGDTKGLLFNIYEGLLKPASDGSLIPAIAESYTIEDEGRIYNFTIREDVKFHNGTNMTADDIVYSLVRAQENKVAGFDNIESVVNEDGEVKITLTEANLEFVYSLAQVNAGIIPKDYEEGDLQPIGTGPFKFESYTPQQSLVLSKFNDYWGEQAKLDEVTVVIEADQNALSLSLQSGNLDAAGLSSSIAEQLDKSKFNIVERNSNAVQLVALNNDYEPLRDIRVRQALNYAINRDEIIEKAFFGYGTKVGTPVIPAITLYHNADLTNAYSFNLQKAKELLKESGYENGFDLEITVPSNYIVHVETAQVVVNQLAAIGIKATIKQVDWPTWLEETYSGRQYQATIVSVGGTSLSPRDELIRYVSTEAGNFFNFKSMEYDTAFETAVKGSQSSDSANLWKQAQKVISDEAVNVFLQDISELTAATSEFDGLGSFPVYGVIDFSTIYSK